MNEEPEKSAVEIDEARFVPRGAIAFFSVMLSCFVVVWLLVYALMLYRS